MSPPTCEDARRGREDAASHVGGLEGGAERSAGDVLADCRLRDDRQIQFWSSLRDREPGRPRRRVQLVPLVLVDGPGRDQVLVGAVAQTARGCSESSWSTLMASSRRSQSSMARRELGPHRWDAAPARASWQPAHSPSSAHSSSR